MSASFDTGLVDSLLVNLKGLAVRPMRFMEVCGTHTVSIFRSGLRSLIPEEIKLVSGPGCPVCVTDQGEIDAFIKVSRMSGVTIATFGDLVRVPGTSGSLAEARAEGADVKVVYSSMDALDIAIRQDDNKLIVFLAVGFETTIPGIAATIKEAKRASIGNFTIFPALKLMPPALCAILPGHKPYLDGLICPGHVSSIIGAGAYRPTARDFGLPCVIAGFEPAEMIAALILLARQAGEGRAEVTNAYPKAVSWDGNSRAMRFMDEVFEPSDARWRGIGSIKDSGLTLKAGYGEFDARVRLGVEVKPAPEPDGCLCGDIIKGMRSPQDCPFFRTRCTPVTPIGPCMVSSEGTCAAHYRYEKGFR